MIFIFEDSPGSWVQKYLRKCYPEESLEGKIFYTCGNRYISTKLDELLSAGKVDEEIAVFLDVVPDNKKTVLMYKQLMKTYTNKFKRLIIFPIPCIEYYYIKQLWLNTKIVNDPEPVQLAVRRGWHKHQKLKRNFAECRTYFQFEKYCKLVLQRCFSRCTRPNRNNSVCYYNIGCPRCRYNKVCYQAGGRQLHVKRLELLTQFPCVPAGSGLLSNKEAQWEQLISIHRKLVDQYNDMAERYNQIDARELRLSSVENLPQKYRCKAISYMY